MSAVARVRRRGRPRKEAPVSVPAAAEAPCVCRVCMRQGEAMALLQDTVVEKLVFCTGVQISESDGLPDHICDSCSCRLDSAYLFKRTCLDSDAALRSTVKLEGPSDAESVHSDRDADCTFDDGCRVKETINVDMKELKCQAKVTSRGRKRKDKNDIVSKAADMQSPDIFSDVAIKLEPLADIEEVLANVMVEKPCEKRAVGRGAGGRRRPLFCDVCDIKFADKAAARRHANTEHKEDPSCVCEYCGKVFEHRSSHYYHMRSHLPPAFSCDQCAYSTWHKHDLVKHKRIHTGLKQYQCEFCSAAYHAVSNLRSHIRRTHERRRDHACAICSHAFFDKRKLLQHLDSHNEIKRYTCNVCGTALSRRNYWARHMLRQHGVRIETPRPGRQKTNYVFGEKAPPNATVEPFKDNEADPTLKGDPSEIFTNGLFSTVVPRKTGQCDADIRSEIADTSLARDSTSGGDVRQKISTVGIDQRSVARFSKDSQRSDDKYNDSVVVPLCKDVCNDGGEISKHIDHSDINLAALPKDLNIAIVAVANAN